VLADKPSGQLSVNMEIMILKMRSKEIEQKSSKIDNSGIHPFTGNLK
jgi:hypothetical protein